MKVPAVTIDVTDDGTAYNVTALPWPTIESEAHPFTARLVHTPRVRYGESYPTKWTSDRLAKFIKTLLKTYPTVTVT